MIRDWVGARPAAILLLLLFEVAVLDTGTLSAAVAFAATAAMRLRVRRLRGDRFALRARRTPYTRTDSHTGP